MKKLSLKNASSMLSRKEMKAINGGYGGYGGSFIKRCINVDIEVCIEGCMYLPVGASDGVCSTCCIYV